MLAKVLISLFLEKYRNKSIYEISLLNLRSSETYKPEAKWSYSYHPRSQQAKLFPGPLIEKKL